MILVILTPIIHVFPIILTLILIKKKIGKFKDETEGLVIEEFVGLKPKLYSISCPSLSIKKRKYTAKGVKRSFSKSLSHNDFKKCLFNNTTQSLIIQQFKNKLHKINTIQLQKIALSPLDDKRYVLNDGIHSRPYGHYLNYL